MAARYTFVTPGQPLVVELESPGDAAADAELLQALSLLLPEWTATPGGEAPTIRLAADGRLFRVSHPGLAPPREVIGLRAAADALADALASSFVQQDPRQLQVHAAAIALPSGLVVLHGASLSGKSSVAVQAASLGAPLAGDDRLAVAVPVEGAPLGIALGLGPRLRLPLPPQAGEAFAAFVAERTRRAANGIAQLALHRPQEQLPAGTRLPIRALVALERRETGALELSPHGAGAALRAFFEDFAAPHLGAEALTRRLHKLVRRVPVHRLAFANSRQAASLILERFGRT